MEKDDVETAHDAVQASAVVAMRIFDNVTKLPCPENSIKECYVGEKERGGEREREGERGLRIVDLIHLVMESSTALELTVPSSHRGMRAR